MRSWLALDKTPTDYRTEMHMARVTGKKTHMSTERALYRERERRMRGKTQWNGPGAHPAEVKTSCSMDGASRITCDGGWPCGTWSEPVGW